MTRVGTLACSMLFGVLAVPALIASPVASYIFNGNTNAQQGGQPALSIVLDTGASSAYSTDTVFGGSRTVLGLTGISGVNAGLQLANATSTISGTVYSAEMIFEFTGGDGAWRKIEDVSNRTLDAGFYVSPSNVLDEFPVGGGATPWTTNAYHDVVVTDSGGIFTAYLDGVLQFSLASNMDIPASTPLSFFLDDAATGKGEFSSSKVAFIGLYNSALLGSDVTALWNNGHPTSLGAAASVPEPAVSMLVGFGLLALAAARRTRHAR
jgi:hypothetical protein